MKIGSYSVVRFEVSDDDGDKVGSFAWDGEDKIYRWSPDERYDYPADVLRKIARALDSAKRECGPKPHAMRRSKQAAVTK